VLREETKIPERSGIRTSRSVRKIAKGCDLHSRKRGRASLADIARKGAGVASLLKTSLQLWQIGGAGSSFVRGVLRDSARGELLNCRVIESDRLSGA